jgi:hypothetical protein
MAYKKADNPGRVHNTAGGATDEYTIVSGRVVLPLLEAPPTDPVALASWSPVAVVQLHEPYRVRNVQVSHIREKAPPLLPSPKDSTRFKFLGGTYLLPRPSENFDGVTMTWEAGAELNFVEAGSTAWFTGFVMTEPPVVTSAEVVAKSLVTPSETTRETANGPRYGETVGNLVNHNAANLGLSKLEGAYSFYYYPSTFLTDSAISGE